MRAKNTHSSVTLYFYHFTCLLMLDNYMKLIMSNGILDPYVFL